MALLALIGKILLLLYMGNALGQTIRDFLHDPHSWFD